jgi:hypothetical protein
MKQGDAPRVASPCERSCILRRLKVHPGQDYGDEGNP